jgi:hypothetical protein
MRKIFSGVFFIMGLIFVTSCNSVKAQTEEINNKIIGRWELCEKDGKRSERSNVRQKVYTKKSYVVLEVDKVRNASYLDFIGTITATSKDKMTETVIYSDAKIKHMLSQSFNFRYRVEGEYLYLEGIDGNPYNEVWIRTSE